MHLDDTGRQVVTALASADTPLSARQLSAAIEADKSAVTRRLDTLLGAHWVERLWHGNTRYHRLTDLGRSHATELASVLPAPNSTTPPPTLVAGRAEQKDTP